MSDNILEFPIKARPLTRIVGDVAMANTFMRYLAIIMEADIKPSVFPLDLYLWTVENETD